MIVCGDKLQGYIINTTPQKNEDLIVTILTKQKIKRLYRFYGARHSIIHVGHKIDFELEVSGLYMPKLKNTIHLGFSWESRHDRLYVWQQFLRLLNKHLIDAGELDEFYYTMLEKGSKKMDRQNPQRVALEMMISLLKFEGRIYDGERCFVCNNMLKEDISLARSMLFAHPECIGGKIFEKNMVLNLLKNGSSAKIDDDEIEKFWQVVIKGL